MAGVGRTASGRPSALSSGSANQRWSVQTQPQHLGRRWMPVPALQRAPPCNVLLPLWQRGQSACRRCSSRHRVFWVISRAAASARALFYDATLALVAGCASCPLGLCLRPAVEHERLLAQNKAWRHCRTCSVEPPCGGNTTEFNLGKRSGFQHDGELASAGHSSVSLLSRHRSPPSLALFVTIQSDLANVFPTSQLSNRHIDGAAAS